MLTITSSKYTRPQLIGNVLYRIVAKHNGDEMFVKRCRYYDAETNTSTMFEVECPSSEGAQNFDEQLNDLFSRRLATE